MRLIRVQRYNVFRYSPNVLRILFTFYAIKRRNKKAHSANSEVRATNYRTTPHKSCGLIKPQWNSEQICFQKRPFSRPRVPISAAEKADFRN